MTKTICGCLVGAIMSLCLGTTPVQAAMQQTEKKQIPQETESARNAAAKGKAKQCPSLSISNMKVTCAGSGTSKVMQGNSQIQLSTDQVKIEATLQNAGTG